MARERNWLIDHIGIGVSDIGKSAKFYQTALAPLGVRIVMCITRKFERCDLEDADLAGVAFGIDHPVYWIDVFHPHGVRQHTAFRATSREQVEAFHVAALAAGGTDNGAPGLRPYVAGYYAAFVLDPDGNNIEAVIRED